MLCQKGGFVKVREGAWLEIGELIIVFGKWVFLIHIHIGNFDHFFAIDFKQRKILKDPMIFSEKIKIIKLK